MSVIRATRPRRQPRSQHVGLALAGGGPLGGTYEIGALLALDEALDGIDLHELDVYVGVSAGAFVASALANGLSIAQIARIFVSNESRHHPISPLLFQTPAYREYLQRAARLPRAFFDAFVEFATNPFDAGIYGYLNRLARVIPTGIFDNAPLQRFLADLYRSRGATDDFRELKRRLFVVAVDLDSGESVRFGAPGHDHVPISVAVQASTALPGLYPPVEIDGRSFVDGALQRTLHASVALDEGARLLIGINPIVPYDADLAAPGRRKHHDNLVEGGLTSVMAQTFRALIHSRMEVGMNAYDAKYDDRDVVLFEPDREDSRMFFTNVFSYARRRLVCEHGYERTRYDLSRRYDELAPVFERHGIRLKRGVLRDRKRTFARALVWRADRSVPDLRYANIVTNRLHQTLEQLSRMLGAA